MSLDGYLEYLHFHHVLSGEFDEAAGTRWLPEEEMREAFREGMRKALLNYGYDVGRKYDGIADRALADMVETGVVQSEGDSYTGMYMQFRVAPKDNHVKQRLTNHEVGRRIDRLGDAALLRALRVLAEEEGWKSVDGRDAEAETYVDALDVLQTAPASDRVVSRTDNADAFSEIDTALEDIKDEINKNNEIGSVLGDDKELIIAEVEASQVLTKGQAFRIQRLVCLLVPALRFFVEKFSGATIGEVAKKLMQLISNLI